MLWVIDKSTTVLVSTTPNRVSVTQWEPISQVFMTLYQADYTLWVIGNARACVYMFPCLALMGDKNSFLFISTSATR